MIKKIKNLTVGQREKGGGGLNLTWSPVVEKTRQITSKKVSPPHCHTPPSSDQAWLQAHGAPRKPIDLSVITIKGLVVFIKIETFTRILAKVRSCRCIGTAFTSGKKQQQSVFLTKKKVLFWHKRGWIAFRAKEIKPQRALNL